MERLHILDGYGYIFRAYYALVNQRGRANVRLSTAGGMPTGALFVYARMLVRLYLDENPDRVVVVFDAPGKSFRSDLDDQYKANRKETPEDLQVQLPYFRPLTEAFQWPVVSVEGVEADDVIATLVRRARAEDMDVVIYSGDKDLMQLVSDHVSVIDAMRQIHYDEARVREKFGVGPDQLGDYLALVGDSSDNIPGVTGVGAKTAAKLLNQFGNIDGILAGTDQLKGKMKERFEDSEQRERLALSRQLVQLKEDVDVPAKLDDLRRGVWNGDALREVFEELEFKALLDQFEPGGDGGGDEAPAKPSDVTIDEPVVCNTAADLEALVAAAREAGRVGLYMETDDQRPVRADIVGVGLAVPGRPPAYVPVGHRYLSAPPQIDKHQFADIAGPLLADAAVAKTCHDCKAAYLHLARIGVDLRGVASDTMLAAYLIDASTDDYGLGSIAATIGVDIPKRTELVGKGKSARGFDAVTVEAGAQYVGTIAGAILAAGERLDQRLDKLELRSLANDVEYPLAHVLSRLERAGVLVDTAWLRQLADRLSREIADIERAVHDIAGGPFNLGSPKQLSELLFNQLGLVSPRMKKTKTGYSTDHEVLEAMRDLHPIVPPLLDHRELVKLKNTYIDALPQVVNQDTGRVHTWFRQAAAATGRLSASDPNLQNIPIRSELGREIRKAFVAPDGYKLLSGDYSQIELRLMAHMSEDPVLCRAFNEGIDVHTQTAAEVFDMSVDDVGPDERRVAKAVNYGLIYGQSDFGLSRALGIPRAEARTYIERYFQRFSRVESFLEEVIDRARRHGEATTILGRRRPIPDLAHRNFRLRSAAERVARNTPLQGSGADILKLAMLRAQEFLDRGAFDARMLLTVHDELLFEVAADQADDFGDQVRAIMEGVHPLSVPLEVDVGIGDNWNEAH